MQGWRCSQEDSHICETLECNGRYVGMCFGVFDGHGGKEVAGYAKEHFKRILVGQKAFSEGKYAIALKETFMDLDKELENTDYAD